MSGVTETVLSLHTRNDIYPLVKIDNRGDLTLAVHETETSGVEKAFLVCSRTLARASDYFEKLLYGLFAEAKGRASADTTPWVVHLYEDDAAAFEILLNVVHAKPKNVPSKFDESLLLTMILMADKYYLTHHLRWVRSSWAPWPGSGHQWWAGCSWSSSSEEYKFFCDEPDPRKIRDVMRLAHLTGHEEMMWCSLLFYAWYCELRDGSLVLPWPRGVNPQPSDAAGSDVDSQDANASDDVWHAASEGSEEHASGDTSIVGSSEDEEDEGENHNQGSYEDSNKDEDSDSSEDDQFASRARIPLTKELYFLPQVYLDAVASLRRALLKLHLRFLAEQLARAEVESMCAVGDDDCIPGMIRRFTEHLEQIWHLWPLPRFDKCQNPVREVHTTIALFKMPENNVHSHWEGLIKCQIISDEDLAKEDGLFSPVHWTDYFQEDGQGTWAEIAVLCNKKAAVKENLMEQAAKWID